jgi:hypothetical protein
MTVKKNPNADSPGDFVGRGGLGAGGGRTYTGSTGGKSIVTGKKSSVSDKTKEKLKEKKKEEKLSKEEAKKLKKILDRRDKEWRDLAKKEEKYANRKPGELNKLFPGKKSW